MRYTSNFIFFSLLIFSSLYGNSDAEAFHLNRIADFWEEGDYQTSKNQMIEFLETYPNSTHLSSIQSALGSLYLKEKKFKEALELFSQIKDPENQKKNAPSKTQMSLHARVVHTFRK